MSKMSLYLNGNLDMYKNICSHFFSLRTLYAQITHFLALTVECCCGEKPEYFVLLFTLFLNVCVSYVPEKFSFCL